MSTSSLQLGISQKQKQLTKPLLLETAKLLALSREEIKEKVEEELANNPFLECTETVPEESVSPDPLPFDEPAGIEAEFPGSSSLVTWKKTTKRIEAEEEESDPAEFLSYPATLLNHLTQQIHLLDLSDEIKNLALWIAGNLNEDGLLDDTLESIAKTCPIAAQPEKWQKALVAVQGLDPAGVGATSLLEVLSLQLQHAPKDEKTPFRVLADTILRDHSNLLLKNDKKNIAKILNREEAEVGEALSLLSALNPHPCARFFDIKDNQVVPDFSVRKKGCNLVLLFHEDDVAKLQFDQKTYALLQKDRREKRQDMENFAKKAKFFLLALSRRKKTLISIVTALYKAQEQFFIKGPRFLAPLSMQELADATGISKSTVSRAVSGKYIETPFGFFPLKHFFSVAIKTNSSETIGATNVRERIRLLIEKEDPQHPLSDSEITKKLGAEGICVARRTVAKYREMEKIPAKSERIRLLP